jgi:transposase
MSASRTRNTYLAARYRRIATRRGPVRAVVAIERTIRTAAWNMLTHHTTYAELGGDYYTRRDPMRAKHKAIRQLEALGYQVIVQPAIP